jgi:succinate dehydrogenase/fumarate reductase flavoprotein subunit
MRTLEISGKRVDLYALDTLVIGSGCAGFNAVDTLFNLGRRDIALLTEGMNMGTSRNTGSDKQTYYKLSLCSDAADSVYELAENLFQGGSVNGDTALAEAAGSLRSFMKLVNLGVPFPTNRYGEYVGYKTDHDPRQRATSCGPLTSKVMTEKLEASVKGKNIPLFDRMEAVRLLTEEGRLRGVIALNKARLSSEDWGVTVFLCNQVILATGGPAIVYGASVYPQSQTGMTGMALEAGAAACNLQEWQYGLASTKFRWNVSGTYQQVLPRYIAVDKEGREREFLPEYFSSPELALNLVFLKGYQWPFDTQKVNGSSLIDLIVYHEIFHKGNRVFLDFRSDPQGLEEGFGKLSQEAREYLERSGATQETPIARLAHMNPGAVELYAAHQIDLYREPLEIALCAQHNNGGLAVDLNWQTTVPGLYAAGEAAGTFGIARPGGSALNSTQVGSQRAAEHIADTCRESVPAEELSTETEKAVETLLVQMGSLLGEKENFRQQRKTFQNSMSLWAGHLRSLPEMAALADRVQETLEHFWEETNVAASLEFPAALKNRDMLLTQLAMLSAMGLTGKECGSRGSALVADPVGEKFSAPGFTGEEELEACRFQSGNGSHREDWVRTLWDGKTFQSQFEKVRPLPKTDDWFENVWKEYRERKGSR